MSFAIASVAGPAAAQAQDAPPAKTLPLPGRSFLVERHPAFLIEPPAGVTAPAHRPWVFYAPTLPRLPGDAENWMFERFLASGIAVAGIDVGESYGSPEGRRLYSALHRRLVEEHGMSPRPVLLARSRGGLMLHAWAAENPGLVAGIAGIYPVCDLRSYPGLARAAPAYGCTEQQLAAALPAHNPVDRLLPLVLHGVPIRHLHGDADEVVPLAANSAVLAERYAALGGNAVVEVVAGGGHDMQPHWFQNEALVGFVVARCLAPLATTSGVLGACDPRCPDGAEQLVGEASSVMVPEQEGGSGWSFEHGVLTASSGWDSVVTPRAYRDFRLHVEFNVNASTASDTEARGNSGVYLQQRYELQILDSHGVPPEEYTASQCGSLYRLRKPDRIAARPAGEWQSYDVVFRAARFADDRKVENARITVHHNGVVVHDDVEVPRKTGAGAAEGPTSRPIKLQGHANPVRFRNVWVQELDLGGARPGAADGEQPAFRQPVERVVEGFRVLVDPTLLDGEHAELGSRALAMLANHLQRIAILVPEAPLSELRKVAIRVERHNPRLDTMQYHPSRGWLEKNGHDPSLAKQVHLPRAAQLLSRAQLLKHPAVVLHELAHAYHDQVLGFDDPGVLEAYRAAMQGGGYALVLAHDGRRVRHYAATDAKEYFAEATEAYLYRNDFFPFVAAELAAHDPAGFALMERVWGKLR